MVKAKECWAGFLVGKIPLDEENTSAITNKMYRYITFKYIRSNDIYTHIGNKQTCYSYPNR